MAYHLNCRWFDRAKLCQQTLAAVLSACLLISIEYFPIAANQIKSIHLSTVVISLSLFAIVQSAPLWYIFFWHTAHVTGWLIRQATFCEFKTSLVLSISHWQTNKSSPFCFLFC